MRIFLRRLIAKGLRESYALYSRSVMPLWRERLQRQGLSTEPYRLLGSMNDEQWFWCLTQGRRREELLQHYLPNVPVPEIQERFTGSSGDATLREGWYFYRLVKRLASQYGMKLSHDTTVLDYGCGWGRIIRFFLKDIPSANLIGIDCLSEVIDICQQTNHWAQFQLVKPQPPTPLADHSIHIIYCYSVFSHLSEEAHLAWLGEFKRLLRPNGLLIATTRPRQFIMDCVTARQQKATIASSGAVSAFLDTSSALQQYDAGEFCYSPVGGGDILDSSFYGESCIPEAYVRREWSRFFTFRTMIDDRSVCHQNVIVMQAET